MVSVATIQNSEIPQIKVDGKIYDKSSQTQFKQGQRLVENTDVDVIDKVLDVGCGNGKTTIQLWEKNRDMHIVGIDVSESQIETARANYQSFMEADVYQDSEYTGDITFDVGDVLKISYENEFDLIFSNAVMHWIMKPNSAYRLMRKALVPGGRIAIHQGGFGTYEGLHKIARMAAENLGYESIKKWEFPAYYPKKEELESLIKEAGFENVRVESVRRDESDNENLVENFANASLIYYKKAGLTEDQYQKLRQEYFRLCEEQKPKLYSHRLYVYANKPAEDEETQND